MCSVLPYHQTGTYSIYNSWRSTYLTNARHCTQQCRPLKMYCSSYKYGKASLSATVRNLIQIQYTDSYDIANIYKKCTYQTIWCSVQLWLQSLEPLWTGTVKVWWLVHGCYWEQNHEISVTMKPIVIFHCHFSAAHKNNANLSQQLPSLLLSVHIQTLDRGSVPHVLPASTLGSICETHVQLL